MMSHNVGNAVPATKTMTQKEYGRIGGLMGGRPMLWKNEKELEDKIEECKKWCIENEKPFSLSRLAYFVGCSRATLVNYSNKEPFFETIEKAKRLSETGIEDILLSGKAQVGAIFSLKNNFGWKDSKEVNVNESITISNVVGQLASTPINAIDGQTVDESELLLE